MNPHQPTIDRDCTADFRLPQPIAAVMKDVLARYGLTESLDPYSGCPHLPSAVSPFAISGELMAVT